MPFDTLDFRLQLVANTALAHCKAKYGGSGIKTETAISTQIGWQPTFYFTPSKFSIVAMEVSDNLYPEALKIAAYDILQFDGSPISVYQVCSLQTYQSDPKQAKVNLLIRHGFGIITVDEDGKVKFQNRCIPLTQHISEEDLTVELTGLNPKLRLKFEAAQVMYVTNEGQGLQQAGQIVEAMIISIAEHAAKKSVISAAEASSKVSDVIDFLYAAKSFKNHRAALGGARDFIKEFRNTASHPPKSAKEAAQKIKKCKIGFLDSISIATKLRCVAREMKYRIQVNTT